MLKTTFRVGAIVLTLVSVAAAAPAQKTTTLGSKAPEVDRELPEEAQIRDGLFASALPTAEERAAVLKISEKGRSLASAQAITEKEMSPELKKMLGELYAAQYTDEVTHAGPPERLEALFVKWNSEYDLPTTPVDKKFYIATLAPLHAFRGIVFRFRPLVYGKSGFIHSALLTKVKEFSTKTNIFLPGHQGQMFFDYISSPFLNADGKTADERTFKSEVDLAQWSVTELLPLLAQSADRLEHLNLSKPIVWDQRIIFGQNSFADGIGRFKLVGEFEKNMSLSGLYSGISSLCSGRAYGVIGGLKLAKTVGKEYGMDGFGLFSDVEGGSSKKVVNVILKSNGLKNGVPVAKADYQYLFRSRESAPKWLGRAKTANAMAFATFKAAWISTEKERHDEDLYMINTGFFNADRQKVGANLNMIERVMNSTGVESLRSDVTGEVVSFNYSKFFSNPPYDLKYFLPVAFDENETRKRKTSFDFKDATTGKTMRKTVELSYRNYAHGSPKSYVISEYQKYFPSVKSAADIEAALRVLASVKGNWLAVPGMPRQ